MCVGLRGKMCLYVSLSGPLWCFHIWALYSSLVLLFSSALLSNLYASSSNPNPILCPPPFTFFPSIRPERVSFTPAGIHVGLCIKQQCSWSLDCCYIKQWEKKKTDDQLTWPEGLCVSNSNEAGVVNFGLWGEVKTSRTGEITRDHGMRPFVLFSILTHWNM